MPFTVWLKREGIEATVVERGVQDVAGEGEIVPSVLGFAFTRKLRAYSQFLFGEKPSESFYEAELLFFLSFFFNFKVYFHQVNVLNLGFIWVWIRAALWRETWGS